MRQSNQIMPLYLIAFINRKYYENEDYCEFAESFLNFIEGYIDSNAIKCEKIIITEKKDVEKLEKKEEKMNQPALFFSLSGSTQQEMIQSGILFDVLGLGITYFSYFVPEHISDKCLEKNAAPAIMDSYSILKRKNRNICLFTDLYEILKIYSARRVVDKLNNSTLLRIGQTEPWVVSANRDIELIKEKLGVNVIEIEEKVVEDRFNNIKNMDANLFADEWAKSAVSLIGINYSDIINASKLIIVICNLISEYNADGVSIACFNLLKKLKTTFCLTLSYLNDQNSIIGDCEGDLDGALTLMLMKYLTGKPVWMANPMLECNPLLRLSHCSAPRFGKFKYDLLKHHESSLGVSPRVYFPQNERVTLSRIGNDLTSLNIILGNTVSFSHVNTCRTQAVIKLDDFDHYLQKVLGCHLVMAFGDYKKELEYISSKLNLKT